MIKEGVGCTAVETGQNAQGADVVGKPPRPPGRSEAMQEGGAGKKRWQKAGLAVTVTNRFRPKTREGGMRGRSFSQSDLQDSADSSIALSSARRTTSSGSLHRRHSSREDASVTSSSVRTDSPPLKRVPSSDRLRDNNMRFKKGVRLVQATNRFLIQPEHLDKGPLARARAQSTNSVASDTSIPAIPQGRWRSSTTTTVSKWYVWGRRTQRVMLKEASKHRERFHRSIRALLIGLLVPMVICRLTGFHCAPLRPGLQPPHPNLELLAP
ncbi:hypothetical protein CYMTET_32230 [Cymbomonas tetramitiformis]|uniref:Uncharacterized protein n=1 Tax=Cymbomonas tetramitiformis TaxID=36881 RepID=A0AAE0KS59_9CHLO|nr:hypothetical protein CYMTET_32230 [Cymbomonas tetramitiformis]